MHDSILAGDDVYRAAAVQNTNEMLRYGWADIRSQLDSELCSWDVYSGEDINDLIRRLRSLDYDALILPTNVCLDRRVRDALEDNRDVIAEFLSNQRGLFMSFQREYLGKSSIPFLPDEYDIGIVRRTEEGTEGHIALENPDLPHPVLKYPNIVSAAEITRHCLENEFARNFYIGYLNPVRATSFDTLVTDDNYNDVRLLLISARADLTSRVVISAMPLDWQNHDRLLQNVIRYVVLGIPQIAVIEKAGQPSPESRYLTANLRINKIAYAAYAQRTLELKALPLDIHSQIILSPAWRLSDMRASDIRELQPHLDSGSRLYYFQEMIDDYPVISSVGGQRQSESMVKNGIPWLLQVYKSGAWDGAFWTTVDVLDTLCYFDEPIEQFGTEVIQAIEPHDKDGSYDEVVVATCGMLRVYSWFLGREHSRYERCRSWLAGRLNGLPFYELAFTIDTLCELDESLESVKIDAFCDEALRRTELDENEVRLYQYAKTMLRLGRADECRSIVRRLAEHQDGDGRWGTLALTASVVTLLLELSERSNTADPAIEEMIFNGVLYIRDQYQPELFCWGSDAMVTARCLRAIHAFGKLVSVPIDELLTSLRHDVIWSRNYSALEISSELNHRLLLERAQSVTELEELTATLERRNAEARRETSRARRFELATTIAAIISLPMLALSAMLLIYAMDKGQTGAMSHFFGRFFRDWSTAIFTALPIGPVIVIYFVVRRFLPRWIGGEGRRARLEAHPGRSKDQP